MGIYVFQNALSYTHYIDAVMYINYTTGRKKCSVCSYMTSQGIMRGKGLVSLIMPYASVIVS